MRFLASSKLWLILAVIAAVSLSTSTALAHERREVGQYEFVVGWIVEPAFEGIKNGLDLRVTNAATEQPVEGLEESLQWEITHEPSGTTRTLDLRTIFRDPGHYTADLIPTAPGVYRFRIFGTIEGTEVNETFVSEGGGGGFGDIEPVAELQFPEQLPAVREIEGAVRGAQDAAQQVQDSALQAEDKASSSSTLAIIGIVLGALGMVSGGGAALLAIRKR